MPKMNYGKLLGRIKELGMTQKTVAEALGVNYSHFCRKLSGEYVFTQSEIQALCELLDIRAEEIGEYFFTPEVVKSQQDEEE